MPRKFSLGWKTLSRPFRTIFWAALVAMLCGVTDMGRPLENYLQTLRNEVRPRQAGGDIVVVAIDDRSIKELGTWPWPRRLHGEIAQKLDRMGAAQVLFDVEFASNSAPDEDRRFALALASLDRRATLAVRSTLDPATGEKIDSLPIPALRKHVDLGTINTRHDFQGAVRSLPYSLAHGRKAYPSLAASIAGVEGKRGEFFPIDHAIDPRTFRTISAVDVLKGQLPPSYVEGKHVLIGATSNLLGDIHYVQGHGRIAGVYLQASGAETLIRGIPTTIGWMPAFLLALLALTSLMRAPFRILLAGIGASIFCVLAIPLYLDAQLVFTTTVPAFILLMAAATGFIRQRVREVYRKRGATNPVSGLPILTSLREDGSGGTRPLILAKIHNYAEVASALPDTGERSLVHHIAGRLKVGNPDLTIYQGDEGIFGWFFDPATHGTIGGYLDGLHALFRSAVRLPTGQVDLSVSFGIDTRSDGHITNRLSSATLAADEAFANGLRWKCYDAPQVSEIAWKLSLLSQLDSAIDAGDIWVAYQPKVSLSSGEMVGAEALVRWNHPERGEIAPLEFIKAAEQSGRIDKLTSFVLDRAVGACARIAVKRNSFGIAVNLSARLIEDKTLVATVADTLARHKLDPSRLTLELTETAALSSHEAALWPLEELRALGVRISIDDYGTGLSTLDYLKRVPATEIKIDKSFVQGVCRSSSDRIMVHSTIKLAHSLGHKVVAEGVEDGETLKALAEMGCDLVQGYFTGRPMTYRNLLTQFKPHQKRRAA